MKSLNQHLRDARDNIRGDEEILRSILLQIPEKKGFRRLISPYVTYVLTTGVSAYALFVFTVPMYNNYILYSTDNALDSELIAIDTDMAAFENNIDAEDIKSDDTTYSSDIKFNKQNNI
jgi:hypothetical protein